MTSLRIVVLLAGGLALGGCYVETNAAARPGYNGVAVQTAQPGYVSGSVNPAPTVYAQPARPACGQCVPGSQEICDGCDNNCNGVIDEGC